MSSDELNSYRFISGEDPTDEMLYAIMTEARDTAVKKAEEARQRYEADYELQYRRALLKWGKRIESMRNGSV